MNEARDHFFPRARRSRDEDAAVGRSNAVDRLQHVSKGGRGTDQLRLSASPQSKLFIFPFQMRRFDCSLDHQQEPVRLERLLDEIVSAELDGADGGLDRAVTADHHHRNQRVLALHDRQQIEPIELAVLQPYIEHDEAGPARFQRLESAPPIGSFACPIALVFKYPCDQASNIGFVVNDENVMCHELPTARILLILRSVPAARRRSDEHARRPQHYLQGRDRRRDLPLFSSRLPDLDLCLLHAS